MGTLDGKPLQVRLTSGPPAQKKNNKIGLFGTAIEGDNVGKTTFSVSLGGNRTNKPVRVSVDFRKRNKGKKSRVDGEDLDSQLDSYKQGLVPLTKNGSKGNRGTGRRKEAKAEDVESEFEAYLAKR